MRQFRAREAAAFNAVRYYFRQIPGMNKGDRQKTKTAGLPATDARRESEARFQHLADTAPVMIRVSDTTKKCTWFNKPWLDFTGRTMEQELGDGWAEGVHPDDLNRCLAIYTSSFDARAPFSMEYRLRRRDGEYRWVLDNGAPSFAPDGAFEGYIGSCIDITERKRAEEAVRELEWKYRTLFDSVRIAVYTCDAEGAIQEFNQCAVELWGRAPQRGEASEQYCGSLRIFYPDGRYMSHAECPMARVLRGEEIKPEESEIIVERPDGLRKRVIAHPQPLKNECGEIVGAVNCLYDVTERKQAEIAVDRYRLLFSSARDAIFFLRPDGKIVEANQAAVETYGYDFATLLQMNVQDLRAPESVTQFAEQLAKANTGSVKFEVVHRRKDGSTFPVEVSSTSTEVGGERLLISIVRDISDRKQAEETSAHLAAIVASSSDVIVSKTLEGIITSWNKSAERIFGYTAEEIVGQSILRLIPPERHDEEDRILARLKAGERIEHYETIRMTKDGRRLNVALTISPVTDSAGKIIGASKIARDITEQKRAEELLHASEEKFAKAFNLSPHFITITSLDDGRFVEVNDSFLEMSGYTREEIIGRTADELNLWVNPKLREEGLARIKQNQAIKNIEAEFRMKNGEVRVGLASAEIIELCGKPCILTVVNDITDRKRAEQEREALLERERAARIEAEARRRESARLAEVNRELVSALGDEDVTRIICRAARELTHAEGASFVLREGGTVFHVDENAVAPLWKGRRFPIESCISGMVMLERQAIVIENIYEDERVPIDAYHPTFVQSLAMMPVGPDAPNAAIGVYWARRHRASSEELSLLRSLAAAANLALSRSQSYEAMRRARIEAEEANRLKDEFLANLSHELRTPLTSILGWSRLLLTDNLNPAILPQAIQTIERNARAQLRIVEDLLDVSRIISGKLKLEMREIELAPVIAAAVEIVRPMAATKSINLQIELDCERDTVRGDAERLQQIVWNLLSNAVKFTPRGGIVCARLRCKDADYAEIEVEDTGQGIAKEFLPFIFDRFRQADGSTTRTHGGLGLGLAITRYLTEMHGGTVRVESEGFGRGAKFIVRLPLALKETKALDHKNENGTADVSLAGMKILIVEDDADTRELLHFILSTEGAEVIAVGAAAEGLDELRQTEFDLLISDVGMPDMDGFEFIKRVRELPPDRSGSIPAIALTAYARQEDRARLLACGYQLHVPKPITPNELKKAVAAVKQTISESLV
jgi:PAS domain S-box-containing protein